MASYSELMEILSVLFEADDAAVAGPLRGRVQNLQRLGVPLNQRVGRGKKVDYGINDIFQIVMCLELAEIGFAPTQAASVIKDWWVDTIAELFAADSRSAVHAVDNMLILKTNQMSESWSSPTRGRQFRIMSASTGPEFSKKLGTVKDEHWRHFCAINISQTVRAVEGRMQRMRIEKIARAE